MNLFDICKSHYCLKGEMKCEEDGQYKLKVHNLQEHRPSLVRGDLVSVRGLADLNGPRFHGRINSVSNFDVQTFYFRNFLILQCLIETLFAICF